MLKYTKKLGSDRDYKRPKHTYQEQLTAEEISQKLKGYEKVDNIEDVALNTHLRYFKTNSDGSQSFRLGGFLFNKKDADKFVVLSNGKNTWCVNVNDSVFFRKLTHEEEIESIHKLYKKKITKLNNTIKELEKTIRKMQKN